jgi:serine/threonine protein kinase
VAERFGRYELLALLGRGGMGEIFRAHDTEIGRDVALKRLPGLLAADPEFTARFLRECRILTRLEHPHIVPIHNFGDIDGTLFIDMRLLRGRDLSQLLKDRGPLPPARAVEIVAQVASALDAAHAAGVMHRDVKPSNIMLLDGGRDGEPFAYLVDFGIAVDGGRTEITRDARVVGSVPYLPPERIDGQPAERRSDVYSLACVLYEALTARAPFGQDNPTAVLYAHAHHPPPRPSAVVPAVPAALDAVVARGMAKAPDQRYQTAGELAADARRALGAGAAPATTVLPGSPYRQQPHAATTPLEGGGNRRRSRRRVFAVAVALAVALIAAGSVVLALQLTGGSASPHAGSDTSASQSAPSTPVSGTSSLSTSSTSSAAAALSPGTCVLASLAPASCDAQHAYEIYATGSQCTFDALLNYLGGVPGTDTLLPQIQGRAVSVGATSYCVLQGPAAQGSGSARDVLDSSAGDAWRRCVDALRQATVACNAEHTAEYVYSASTATASVNCTDKASAYMNHAFADFASDLSVQKATSGTSIACVVSVRGGDVLTGSVRRLGTGALPLQPR